MWQAAEDVLSLLHALPGTLWLIVSVVLLSASVAPPRVAAVHDFAAYRLQQLDLHGVSYGSRSVVVNMEAKGATAGSLGRKCVVVRWADLKMETLLDLVERGAGSLLLLLPQNFSDVHGELAEQWRELERSMVSMKIAIPVYFALEEDTLDDIHDSLSNTAEREKDSTVTSYLWDVLTGYGYQMISEDQKEPEIVKDSHITTITGRLAGLGVQQRLPTVMVVAHYDSFGAAPSLSTGVDSNGSGVAALLALARLFSRLYRDVKQRPRSNLLFVLSGGGKLNYFGTKNLLEEASEDLDSLIQSSDYVLCLDSLGSGWSHDQSRDPSSHSLAVHVSKPPKEHSKAAVMIDLLNKSFSQLVPGTAGPLKLVHKKIRLSEDLLSWEHERFSLKRLPAATISSFHSHQDTRRHSMFVNRSHIDLDTLAGNVHALANGLAHYLFNFSSLVGREWVGQGAGLEVFPRVSSGFLSAWIDFLAGHARSPQLVTEDHPMVAGLYQAMSQSLDDVTKLVQKPERGDPEFVLYSVPQTLLHAHRVKSPIFDLFVAVGIALYLSLWYCLIEFFPWSAVGVVPLPFIVKSKNQPTTSSNKFSI